MNDRSLQFNLTSTLASLAGAIGIALVVLNFFITGDDVGDLGLTFVCIAAMLRIRGWFCAMSARERTAFEMGRESAKVHSVR